MSESSTYLSCSKCDSLIYKDFIEIHEIECHQSSVEFTHPFIKVKESFMATQVMQVGEDSATASSCLIHKSDWININVTQFLKSLAFLNEKDMQYCNFTPFSVILISDGDAEAFFLPVLNKDVPPMTVILFDSGLQKFRKYEKNIMLYLRKVDKVSLAKEVYFTAKSFRTELNLNFIEELLNGINLRVPYMLKKGEELNFLGTTTLTIADIKANDDFSYANNYMLQSLKIYNSIQYISIKDWKNSGGERSQNCSLLEITSDFKDIDLNQSTEHDKLLTFSTPNKSSKTSKRKKKKSKVNSLNFKAISSFTDEISTCYKYFNLNEDTKCYVIHDKIFSKIDNVNSESSFYRDADYSFITKLISRKLQSNLELKFSLGCMWSGILLTGHSGTGKTTLVHKLSIDLNLPLVIVSLSEWAKSSLPESEFMLQSYSQAKEKAPSILFFDEIDSLCFKKAKANEGFTYLIFKFMKEAKNLKNSIIFICASNRPEEIPSKLLECGRFDKEIILTLPDVHKKTSILWYLISTHGNALTRDEVIEIAKLTKGFSAADLQSLVKIALHLSFRKWKVSKKESGSQVLTFNDFKESISSIVPSFLRQNYVTIKEVYWCDIYGYENVKKQIMEMLVNEANGTYELKGLLLFGPPGCSKTMFVKAIATETSFTYFPVKCSDLLSKYVGETERSLCSLFRRASMSAPSIIFMDEIDSICGERSGQGCVQSVVVTELVSLMQRATSRGDVMIIGATNRPQAVDESLLSPGCFESLLYIDLPDCHSRCSIWKGLLNGVPTLNIDVQSLCNNTIGFSGAEIIDIYQRTAQTLMVNYMENQNANVDDVIFTQQDFFVTFENVQPRTSTSVVETNKTFYDSRKGLIFNKLANYICFIKNVV